MIIENVTFIRVSLSQNILKNAKYRNKNLCDFQFSRKAAINFVNPADGASMCACMSVCLSVSMSLLWLIRSHQMYYMFGFLFLVFIILLVTCSETAILLCYFHLCAEVSRQSYQGLHLTVHWANGLTDY